MNAELLTPFISKTAKQFWLNTVDPKNIDSLFLQHGMDSIDVVFDYIRARPDDMNIFNLFFRSNYLLNNEYLISYTNAIVLTNYRLFLWYSDLKLIIPLNQIKVYKNATWDNGVVVEYVLNDSIQKFALRSTWMYPENVNNAYNRHNQVHLSPEERVLISNFKATLQSQYSLVHGSDNEPAIEEPKPKINNVSNANQFNANYEQVVQKKQVNYRGLAFICLLLVFFGGCFYYIADDDTPSSNYSSSNQYCTKHDVTYSPNNAYGGCPKCVKEKQAKDAADAMEKKIYGR